METRNSIALILGIFLIVLLIPAVSATFTKTASTTFASDYACFGMPFIYAINGTDARILYQWNSTAPYGINSTNYNIAGNSAADDKAAIRVTGYNYDNYGMYNLSTVYYFLSNELNITPSTHNMLLCNSTDGKTTVKANCKQVNTNSNNALSGMQARAIAVNDNELWVYYEEKNATTTWNIKRRVYYRGNDSFGSDTLLFTESTSTLRSLNIMKFNSTYYLYYAFYYSSLVVRNSTDGVTFGATTTLLSGDDTEYRNSVVKMCDKYYLIVETSTTTVKLYEGTAPDSFAYKQTLTANTWVPNVVAYNDSLMIVATANSTSKTNINIEQWYQQCGDEGGSSGEENITGWDTGWQYCRNITGGTAVGSNVIFPALLTVNSTNINYTAMKDDGTDIRIFDAECGMAANRVPYEIELFDNTSNSEIWFLANSSKTYSYYYGNKTAVDRQNSSGLWQSYKVVYHMDDTTTSTVSDSTGNADTGTKEAANAPVENTTANCKIGKCQTFDGNDDWIDFSSMGGLGTSDVTMEGWLKYGALSTYVAFLSQFSGDTKFSFYPSWGTANQFALYLCNGACDSVLISSTQASNQWVYVVGRRNATSLTLFVNGQQNNTAASTPRDVAAAPSTRIGARSDSGANDYTGSIDEVRVTLSALSNAQINASYQAANNNIYAFSAEQEYEAEADTTPPQLVFDGSTLANNSYTANNSWIYVHVSGGENLGKCYLNWVNNDTNISMTTSADTCYVNITSLVNQTAYYFRVYGNDTAGNLNKTEDRQITINLSSYSPPATYCGDDTCDEDETCSTCEEDCGACPPSEVCGDSVCNGTETCSTCSGDCGVCSTFCYQETANVSTACGGLSTGSYTFSGAGNLWCYGVSPCSSIMVESNLYDGNWQTGDAPYGTGPNVSYMWINYTKPLNATSNSLWRVGDVGGAWDGTNLTIPSSCWNYNSTELSFMVIDTVSLSGNSVSWYCYDGSWYLLRSDGNEVVYEEAMWWQSDSSVKYYSTVCNMSSVGTVSCGGFNSQMVLTCEKKGGYYDWSDDQEYCPYGCYQGVCVDYTDNATDNCEADTLSCRGNYVISCNLTSKGNYDWVDTVDYCQFGCYQGNCLNFPNDCSYGEQRCNSGNRENCTLNGYGSWAWTTLQECQYGCEYYMQGTTMLNTTCSSVQDAHLTNDAANMVANDFAFVFAPVLFGAFMVFAIAVSLFAAVKSKSAEGGIWVFIMMLILGTVIGPVPWYATGLFAAIFLGFKAYGRVSNA